MELCLGTERFVTTQGACRATPYILSLTSEPRFSQPAFQKDLNPGQGKRKLSLGVFFPSFRPALARSITGRMKGKIYEHTDSVERTTPVFVIALSLACVALLPKVQAVVPPPDGGYPNFNTAEGQSALFSLTSGIGNTAVGGFALWSNAASSLNTATGAGTLLFNTADDNTANGALALFSNSTGNGNTAIGSHSLESNTEGYQNTACGFVALDLNATGHDNTAIGTNALGASTGSFNVALGSFAGDGVSTADHVICIGDSGANVSNSCYIGNTYGTVIDPATTLAVGMDASHRLGTAVSAERFKRDIQPMERASEAILALKPVTFHYRSDSRNTPCFGLVAEHVADVDPNLVVSDKEGKPYAVRYDQVNAMLLNEFLKEHRKNEQQEATIARLEKQLEIVTATLQKVSAQLDLSKPAPQTASNNHAIKNKD